MNVSESERVCLYMTSSGEAVLGQKAVKKQADRGLRCQGEAETQQSVVTHSTMQTFLLQSNLCEFTINIQSIHPCSGCRKHTNVSRGT